jgi:thymidylate synthase
MAIDRQYEDLCRDVLHNGALSKDRTGVGTLSVFGRQLRYDLSKGYPAITTKRLFFRGVIEELLWFLRGETNIKSLVDRNVHIWDAWAKPNGDLGPVYGSQWRNWNGEGIDQIQTLIDTIKNDPWSRRMILSAWNVGKLSEMALVPCHMFAQFSVREGKLSISVYQRSADLFLGVPFDLASYAALTHMIAQQTGLKVGDMVYTFGDAHIYLNHQAQVAEMLSREVYPFPPLIVKQAPSINDYHFDDFYLDDYRCYPSIKAPVAI